MFLPRVCGACQKESVYWCFPCDLIQGRLATCADVVFDDVPEAVVSEGGGDSDAEPEVVAPAAPWQALF